MNDNARARVKSVFMSALDHDPGPDRDAYLNQACGEERNLRQQVEELLIAHEEQASYLEGPALAPTVALSPVADELDRLLDSTIGPYKIREQIGEGGFGMVYVAEQSLPIKRKVALKLIKPGMDSKEIIARFEAERQALAMMDHPHIAKVLDAGTTDEGRPYFVMELVNGLPLTTFCDQQRSPITDRLRLFVDVCRAVQHAHQKGIIHRDIKPSNVLVTLHDGKPVAKVIDFGIAKALSQPLTEHSVYTALGQMVGTPLYMSPEQAEMSGLGVDTRSDIYSLGVLLYELLTGTTPFDKESLKNIRYAEVQMIIRETQPLKPSARLSTLKNEDRSTVSDQRRLDHRKLEQALRGDLDWVVMKALEKDRERRYASAADFADDVERYLAQRPVVAGPPSSLYRLRRHVRRHKLTLTATALVLLSMIAGTGFSVWYAVEAQDARDQAEKSEGLANERLALLQQEQANLRTEKQTSERRFTLAKEAVAKLVDEVASQQLSAFPEFAELRESLLETAEQFYSDLLLEAPGQSTLLLSRAGVRRNLNQYQAALEDYLAAVEHNPDDSRAHLMLSEFYRNGKDGDLRDPDLALKHNQQAVELAPDDAEAWYHLAWVYYQTFSDSERGSEAMFRCAALTSDPSDYQFHLGIAQRLQGRYAEAIASLTKAIELRPGQYDRYIQRADCYIALDRLEEAVQDYTHAIQINAFSPVAFALRARIRMTLGDYAQAAADWEQSYRLDANLFNFVPKYRGLLYCYLQTEAWDKAAALLNSRTGEESTNLNLIDSKVSQIIDSSQDEELIIARDRFVDRIAERLNFHKKFHSLAYLYKDTGRYEQALNAFEVALTTDDNPMVPNSVAWFLLTCPDPNYRNPERAKRLALRSISLLGEKSHETGRRTKQRLHSAWNTYGVSLYYLGRWKEALTALNTAHEVEGTAGCGYCLIFKAMAHQQLEDEASAKSLLQDADEWTRLRKHEGHEKMIQFRREAVELIGQPSGDPVEFSSSGASSKSRLKAND